jgi:hypothetical protein
MLFYRHPLLLLYMWPVMILINLIFVQSVFGMEGLANRSVWLVPMDAVYFFTILHLGLYASLHPKQFVSLLKENLFLSIFLAVLALYVVIYTPTYGKTAIGEARKLYFMFLFPLLASIVIKTPEALRRFVQVVILSAAVVGVLALASAGTQGTLIRVANAERTLIIAFAAFAMLIHRFHSVVVFHPILDRLLLFSFAGLAIGSGQRSAWLAVGLGSLLLLLLHSTRRTLMVKIGVVGLALLIALGTTFVYFPEVGAKLGQRLAGIIDPSSDPTASWRIAGWRYQLERLERSGRLLFGDGFGRYYWWEFEGRIVTVSPHNAYVQMALKLGLFGLAIYGLLVFEFFRRALVSRKRLPAGPMRAYLDMGILNFGAGHGYLLGYGMVPFILIFFAVAVCAIKLSENFHKVTTRSRVRVGRLGRIGWQPNMPAPHVPVTRYER